jgi:hypothetical protein
MNPIVVLCGHSSGSSAVAAVLSGLGIDMGETHFLPPTNSGRGYYEDARFVALNRAIIRHAGGRWWNPPTPLEIMETESEFHSQILDLLNWRKQEAGGRLWGWKDPRMVVTFPLYAQFLDKPRFVVVQRNHRAMARSLANRARDGMPYDQGLIFSEGYSLRMLALVGSMPKSVPVHYVHYDLLCEFTGEKVANLARFAGVLDTAIRAVDPTLRHY